MKEEPPLPPPLLPTPPPSQRERIISRHTSSLPAIRFLFFLILFDFTVHGHSYPSGFYVSNGQNILLVDDETGASDVVHNDSSAMITSIALDLHKNQLIFWSDVSMIRKGIYKASINSTGHVLLPEKLDIQPEVSEVYGIVVDSFSDMLYWTDAKQRTVEVLSYSNHNRRTLVFLDLGKPRGIHLDLDNGFLFWNDQEKKRIERSRLDGSDRKVIVNDAPMPNHMFFFDNHLYWTNSEQKLLESCRSDGSHRNIVSSFANEVNGSHVYGLAVASSNPVNDYINNDQISVTKFLVTSWKNGIAFILTASNRGEGDLQVISKTTAKIEMSDRKLLGAVFIGSGENKNPRDADSPCSASPCDQLCFNVDDKARCLCDSYGGFVQTKNGLCTEPEDLLLFTMADEGFVAYFSPSMTNKGAHSPVSADYLSFVSKTRRPIAVTYDSVNEDVYWSDVIDYRIYKSDLSGKDVTVLLDASAGIGIVDGLVFDPATRLLYFTNIDTREVDGMTYSWHRVEVVNVDDVSKRRTIISTGDMLRALAVDMDRRYIYYTDWGVIGCIMRCNIDGTNITVIRSGLDNPNGILLHGGFIFFVDSHYKSSGYKQSALYRMKLDGRGLEIIQQLNQTVPFGITADRKRNVAYISLWDNMSIFAMNLTSSALSSTSFRAPPLQMLAQSRLFLGTVLSGVNHTMGVHYSLRFDESIKTDAESANCNENCDGICLRIAAGHDSDAVEGHGDDDDDKSSSASMKCLCNSIKGYFHKEMPHSSCSDMTDFVAFVDVNSIKSISLNPPNPEDGDDDDADDGNPPATFTLMQGSDFNYITTLAYHEETKSLYFYDLLSKTIASYNLATSQPSGFSYRLNHVISSMVAVGNNLFWVDAKLGAIYHVSLTSSDSRKHSVLVKNLDKPRSLKQYMGDLYWIEQGDNPRVVKARLSVNGSAIYLVNEPEQVLPDCTGERITWSSNIHLDDGCLYFTHEMNERTKLYKCLLDGSLASDLGVILGSAYDIFISRGFLYYTDWHGGTFNLASLENLNGTVRTVSAGLMRPGHVAVRYSGKNQLSACTPKDQEVQCANGFCTPLMGRFIHCTCPPGKVYDADSRLCIDSLDPAYSCQYNDQTLPLGTVVHPTDCHSCKCHGRGRTVGDGEWLEGFVCSQIQCPTLVCPDNLQKILPGECCPICEKKCTLEFVHCPDGMVSLTLSKEQNFVIDEFTPQLKECTSFLRHVNLTRTPAGKLVRWEKTSKHHSVTIKYEASALNEESQLDRAQCSYEVTLKDDHPPLITCPEDVTVETFDDAVQSVFWTQPQMFDNSEDFSFSSTSKPGDPFRVGSHVVKYVITDSSGHSNNCSFNITVEKITGPSTECNINRNLCSIPQLFNGRFDCTCSGNLLTCGIFCNHGFSQGSKTHYEVNYTCSPDFGWRPKLPENFEKFLCRRLVPKTLTISKSLSLLGACGHSFDPNYTTQYVGQQYYKKVQEETGDDPSIVPQLVVSGCQNNAWSDGSDVTLEFKMVSKSSTTTEGRLAEIMLHVMNDIDEEFINLELAPAQLESSRRSYDHVYSEDSFTYACEKGEISFKDDPYYCMPCPPGTFWAVPKSNAPECIPCPENTFNSAEGQDRCLHCMEGSSSVEGATLNSQCVDTGSTPPKTSTSNAALFIIGGSVAAFILFVVIIFLVRHCYRTGRYNVKRKASERNGRLCSDEIDIGESANCTLQRHSNGTGTRHYQRFDHDPAGNGQPLIS